jgi:hypothetical protein
MTGFKTLFLAAAVAGSMVNAQTITADMINAVAKDNQECKVGEVDEQCVPASEIPPFLEASFKTYNICSKNVMAAVTALISLESGSFRYKENKFPGRRWERNLPSFLLVSCARRADFPPQTQVLLSA